ncbi:MAG TPA: ABC transporter ATP-binding protein [Thermoanaerobaculia bacterium]|nr:ABC transporter ATP-binding protein [Thermoanaerobaculia bacterium]
MKELRGLLPYFRPYRRAMALGMLSIVVSVVIGLASPLLVGHAVDSFKSAPSLATLLTYAALLVAVAASRGIFTFLQRLVLVTMSRDIEVDLRDALFAQLERLSPSFFHRHATGDLMARATNDLSAVRMLCGPAIMYSTNTVCTALGSLFFMFRIHPGLALLSLAPMPVVAVVTKVFGQRIHALFEGVQEQFSRLSARVQENLSGLRVVRAYAREDWEEAQFATVNEEYVARNRVLVQWGSAFNPLLQGLVGLGFVAVLWYGGRLVLDGRVTIGQFVTFNFFLGKLVWPMIAIGWVINLAQRGAASFGRIRQVLDTMPEVRDEEPLVRVERIVGRVDARGLTFRYAADLPPALVDVELAVAPGETVALVGRTGAGKSTLLSLLPRLYNPPEGALRVDGVDARRLPLATLRGAIGMVPQETFLFSQSIHDNIALGKLDAAGRPAATREEVVEAAELAGLGDDLAAFPQGLDTVVGERGITLSGGQKQRVALARALLRRPQLLLLDDCLSAVDTQTEERILGNLRRVFPGRTVFLVSHRISAVRDADQILVLAEGRVVERGNHAELVARGGIYADLHRRQMLEEELAAI